MPTANLIKEILPDELSESLEIINLLPIIMDDEEQMLIPYQIIIQ